MKPSLRIFLAVAVCVALIVLTVMFDQFFLPDYNSAELVEIKSPSGGPSSMAIVHSYRNPSTLAWVAIIGVPLSALASVAVYASSLARSRKILAGASVAAGTAIIACVVMGLIARRPDEGYSGVFVNATIWGALIFGFGALSSWVKACFRPGMTAHDVDKSVLPCLVLFAAVGVQHAWACNTPPPPPLRQKFANAPLVYLARLKDFKSSPWPGVRDGAIEDATFSVLMTLKGPAPKNGELKTHTKYWGGNCTLSIPAPVEVRDSKGKVVPNPFSDVWILFLHGDEPYALESTPGSLPMNLFGEEDLRFLLDESQDPQRTRDR